MEVSKKEISQFLRVKFEIKPKMVEKSKKVYTRKSKHKKNVE